MQGTAVQIPVRSTGDAVRASLAGALDTFLAVLPRVIGFAVVLGAGWLLSSLLARGVTALLQAIRFNDLARRSGLAEFVRNMGVRQDSTGVIAAIAKWFVRLIALVVAFDTLGLPAVSGVLQQLLLWLPNLVVGLVVLVIGGLLANALANLVRGATANAGFTNPNTLATVARAAVWGFAIVVAVSQLGIATTIINTIVIGVVAALALASGLAFGLGGRDKAAQLLDRLGHQQPAPRGPKLERTAPPPRTEPTLAEMTAPILSEPSMAPGEDWIERSGMDRRRVPRPNPDRRAAGNGSWR